MDVVKLNGTPKRIRCANLTIGGGFLHHVEGAGMPDRRTKAIPKKAITSWGIQGTAALFISHCATIESAMGFFLFVAEILAFSVLWVHDSWAPYNLMFCN